MASPPYAHFTSALSPPYPTNASLPQAPKRRQSEMGTSIPQAKRRKASILSTTSTTSTHPLRQTSFPPEVSTHTPAFSRSPSIDTMSLVSGSVTGPKKKRPRKSKGGGKGDDESLTGGASRAKSAISGEGGRGASVEEEEDDGDQTALATAANTNEETQKEKTKLALLTQSFDEDQWKRYEAWRSSKLSDAVVRRLVNQTLSQSVPMPVILAVKSAAKVFAGEVIEEARKVQTQWLEASGEDEVTIKTEDGGEVKEKETRRGPLVPDHLREAFRRFKIESSGSSVGQLGLWQLQQHSGVERFGVRVQGKRLMK